MEKLNIKEIIIVEGKDDISAVKKAVNSEVIGTNGLGLDDSRMELIVQASKKQGIIILTDPDYPGEKIRNMISTKAENVKHAFIKKEKTIKNNNLGIENAHKDDIIDALIKAHPQFSYEKDLFTTEDLVKNGLVGQKNSSAKRKFLGDFFNIGYCSAKKFLKRINSFGLTKEEFYEGLNRLKAEEINE